MDPSKGCISWFKNGDSTARQDAKYQGASPSGQPTPEEMDSLIAKEMTQLSMVEREEAMYDIHGIGSICEEDPVFMRNCLNELAIHINQIKPGTAYASAEAMSKDYVSNEKFRMLFLRADKYSPTAAAERIIRFFEQKKFLFGGSKLVKHITLDDFDADDMDTLSSGYSQVCPYKDNAGRQVVVFLQERRRYKTVLNVLRTVYYIFMSAMESDEAQTLGIVTVWYAVDADHGGSNETKAPNSKLRNSLPIHFAALHFCFNDLREFAKACIALKIMGTRNRVRYRSHYGSHVECLYKLMAFGIPNNRLPVTPEGNLLTHQHLVWLQRRREMEAGSRILIVSANAKAPVNTPSIAMFANSVSPVSIDVVFGRGKFARQHPGNTRFRSLVDFHKNNYDEAGKLEKTCIAGIVVRQVKDYGGRFLKEVGGRWEEVDDTVAHEKVSHAFRNRRKLVKS